MVGVKPQLRASTSADTTIAKATAPTPQKRIVHSLTFARRKCVVDSTTRRAP
jgi:hypothetical protein